jgi:hypothetical protein
VPFSARRSTAAADWEGKIYFFGGVGGRGTESILDVDGDLWCFAPEACSWEKIGGEAASSFGVLWPSARRCSGFASDAEGIYLWGGSGVRTDAAGQTTYTFLNDLWLFQPPTGRWQMLESSDDFTLCPVEEPGQNRPEPRYTPIWHLHSERGLLFGGYTEDRLGKRKMNDLWLRHGPSSTWRRVPNAGRRMGYSQAAAWPGVRYGAMSASDSDYVYVCGGFADDGDHLDVWRWSWTEDRWECLSPDDAVEPCPQPRYCAACAVYSGGFWLFGGRSRRYPKLNFNDTWRFDLAKRRWESVELQSDVHCYGSDAFGIGYHAKSSSAVVAESWYVWGGEGLHGHVSDFWRFDLNRCTWQMIQPSRDDDPKFW